MLMGMAISMMIYKTTCGQIVRALITWQLFNKQQSSLLSTDELNKHQSTRNNVNNILNGKITHDKLTKES